MPLSRKKAKNLLSFTIWSNFTLTEDIKMAKIAQTTKKRAMTITLEFQEILELFESKGSRLNSLVIRLNPTFKTSETEIGEGNPRQLVYTTNSFPTEDYQALIANLGKMTKLQKLEFKNFKIDKFRGNSNDTNLPSVSLPSSHNLEQIFVKTCTFSNQAFLDVWQEYEKSTILQALETEAGIYTKNGLPVPPEKEEVIKPTLTPANSMVRTTSLRNVQAHFEMPSSNPLLIDRAKIAEATAGIAALSLFVAPTPSQSNANSYGVFFAAPMRQSMSTPPPSITTPLSTPISQTDRAIIFNHHFKTASYCKQIELQAVSSFGKLL